MAPLNEMEYGVYGDLIIIYPKPYSIYLRGTIRFRLYRPTERIQAPQKVERSLSLGLRCLKEVIQDKGFQCMRHRLRQMDCSQ